MCVSLSVFIHVCVRACVCVWKYTYTNTHKHPGAAGALHHRFFAHDLRQPEIGNFHISVGTLRRCVCVCVRACACVYHVRMWRKD